VIPVSPGTMQGRPLRSMLGPTPRKVKNIGFKLTAKPLQNL
jgi:hypothetical protein